MQIKNYNEVLHRSERPSSKCLQIINAGEGVEPFYIVCGNLNW